MYSRFDLVNRISELKGSLYEYELKLSRLKDDLETGAYYEYDDQVSAIDHCESIISDIEYEISSLEDELEIMRSDSFDGDEVLF